jgi:hypothetical protein
MSKAEFEVKTLEHKGEKLQVIVEKTNDVERLDRIVFNVLERKQIDAGLDYVEKVWMLSRLLSAQLCAMWFHEDVEKELQRYEEKRQ